MTDVFISYITEEKKIAEALKNHLELTLHLNAFVSSADIYAGDDWLNTIQNNLETAKITLLLLSPKSISRPWIWLEGGFTIFKGKKLIPVLYGGLQKNSLDIPRPFGDKQAKFLSDLNEYNEILGVIAKEFDKNNFRKDNQGFINEINSIIKNLNYSNPKKEAVITNINKPISDMLMKSLNNDKKDFNEYINVLEIISQHDLIDESNLRDITAFSKNRFQLIISGLIEYNLIDDYINEIDDNVTISIKGLKLLKEQNKLD